MRKDEMRLTSFCWYLTPRGRLLVCLQRRVKRFTR